MKTILISEFKAKCIQELKHVNHSREPLVVTLHGRPLVTILPYEEQASSPRLGALRGQLKINGDIVHGHDIDDWED